MSGGSSKSDSEQNTTTTSTNTSANTNISDNSGLAFGSVEATSIEVLDAGAIENSFEFAKETQANFGQSFESVLGLVEKSIDAQGDALNSQSNSLSEILGAQADATAVKDTGGISKIIPLLGFAAVAGFVIIQVMKK